MSKQKRREGEHVPNGAYWPAGLDEAEYCRRCREPWPCRAALPAIGADFVLPERAL